MTDLLFEIPRTTIQWKSGGKDYGFTVRGLSDEDLIKLVRDNQDDLEKAHTTVQQISEKSDVDNLSAVTVKEFGMALLEAVPALVAQMIALAADDPDKVPVVRKLPAPTKLTALMAIWNLTVVDTGGLAPFLEQVLGLMRDLRMGVDAAKSQIQAASLTA
jgi:hypothetical protein